ncbi:MAG: 3-deoxy-manno-octulosonate cytidylyltransferase [Thermodesulfobacteriota bacterium]|nr:3-deoxy-manno-octulosonate cytidylyltransferase [Thermodesulfobacteriota bacterium]
MSVVAVIPARYDSKRFPGKPLIDIAGKPMICRVYEQALLCKGIDHVVVATDDTRILDAVNTFGGNAVMTDPDCKSGTDRVAQAVKSIRPGRKGQVEIVINIQGDQVIFDPDAITDMIHALSSGCPMATIATKASPKDMENRDMVKVVCNEKGSALYFSRAPIPYLRNHGFYTPLKHIGIYGFCKDTLEHITTLKPSPLEKSESLEQLRAVENGIPIKVIVSGGEFFEINTPEGLTILLSRWQG